MRVGSTFASSLRGDYYDISLPEGHFTTVLWRLRTAYSFTPRLYLQTLLQYNKQASTFSSNVRLALLNRSGTGFFLVYNDRRDTSEITSDTLLGRSLILKYTRLFSM